MAGPTSASNLSLSSAMGVAPSSNPELGEQDEENHLLCMHRTPVRPFSRSNDSGITNDSGLSEEQRGEQLSVGERVKDMRDQLRKVDKQMEKLSFESNTKESQLQASLEKNDHYEDAFDRITLQLQSLLDFQSGMIGHYEEERRLTMHILETITNARSPYNGGKHVKRRTVLDEGTHSRRSSAQMSQRLGSYNSAPTLKEATEEPQEESDFLLQQGLAHQHQMNRRAVSTHDTGQFPEITSRHQHIVSPVSPPPDSSISEIFLGNLPEDANSDTQGAPKSPLASSPDRPERDDGTRRRPSSAKEGGSTKNRSTPGTKGGSVYAQSVVPKKQK